MGMFGAITIANRHLAGVKVVEALREL